MPGQGYRRIDAPRAKFKSATALLASWMVHRARLRGCVVHSIAGRFLDQHTT